MGVFDSIRIPVAWCPYCGHKLVDELFQTKTGEYEKLSFAVHQTIEDFAKSVQYYGGYVEVHIGCSNCGKYISLNFPNEWEEVEIKRDEQDKAWKKEWIEEDTSHHPNHDIDSYRGHGESLIIGWRIGHCSICKERGQKPDQDIPDMDPEYRGKIVSKAREETETRYIDSMKMLNKWRHESRELSEAELDQIIVFLPLDTQLIIKAKAEEIFRDK